MVVVTVVVLLLSVQCCGYIDLRFGSALSSVFRAIDHVVEKNPLPLGHKVGCDICALTALLFSVFPKYRFYRRRHMGE